MITDSIFSYDELYEDQLDCLLLGHVSFKRDFGPFKKDERIDSMKVDFVESILSEYDYEGNVLRSVKIGLCNV